MFRQQFHIVQLLVLYQVIKSMNQVLEDIFVTLVNLNGIILFTNLEILLHMNVKHVSICFFNFILILGVQLRSIMIVDGKIQKRMV